jgi:hypothetical protein
MVNKQLTTAAKVKRQEKALGAKATDNPDDVLHVLQTARRLLADGGRLLKDGWQEKQSRQKPDVFSIDGALRRGLDLAHPVNRDSTAWAAQYALNAVIEADETFKPRADFQGHPVLVKFNNHPDTTLADAITVYDRAIKAQGRIKVVVSKSKGRK